ncbi:MAG: hypothetical protein ACK55Z_35800, partial [bacterium]
NLNHKDHQADKDLHLLLGLLKNLNLQDLIKNQHLLAHLKDLIQDLRKSLVLLVIQNRPLIYQALQNFQISKIAEFKEY